MKVLVIGGGGREHALVWSLLKSLQVNEVVCAPGNGGITQIARCLPVDVNSLASMVEAVEAERPDLTVIGPEVPLSLGIVDELTRRNLRVFGPTQAAAKLESSKAFAKEFMQRHGIPTAAYAVCTTLDEVREQLNHFTLPVVVKADGLAAGKGVVICETRLQAESAAAEMFSGVLLGTHETEIVLEEFLTGEELSFFALCDGKHAAPIASAQDHKRVGEGDTGPNTGGMGAYSTDGLTTTAMREWLTKNVAQKVVDGMASEGQPFKGILFCGIMMTPRGPMVLEFNTRFGDPETQAILLRMQSNIVDLFNASIDGTANALDIRMHPGASVCVIAASGGYPGKYASGKPIHGIPDQSGKDVVIFHSGTAIKDGQLVTAGGRVLAITAMAPDLRTALDLAYAELAKISFEGMQFRRDIGHRALALEQR
ncbi:MULTISPECIES: phosphoribosylamine--glycine ligase [Acidobacteriaceae]|uniref:phosphoribosylamine--glycine ligase n=1 Tax=Acidobacteriaceae TaxID=204434 RepID=UPI00131B4D23|nr:MULTISPECIES: phosphoribosylamine--glycine ligase [Acidobacteriaceae]MDW5265765.1 phosphoribosylamine--glycine ligase [Edaphobacter sp.]